MEEEEILISLCGRVVEDFVVPKVHSAYKMPVELFKHTSLSDNQTQWTLTQTNCRRNYLALSAQIQRSGS